MNFKPLGEFVLIKPIQKEVTSGLIVELNPQAISPDQGEVIAVGSGRISTIGKYIAPSVKPGDKVIFHEGSADELILEEIPYLLVRESSIVAII